MPANLPPQYSKAEERHRRATSPPEKLDALREMFRLLPKHKGTEKLQADLKQKISRAKDEIEGARAGAKKSGVSHKVPREGAGRVVLVGPPNAGKSAILAALTNAKPEVAAYPFTTRVPQPGLLTHKDVRIQLLDLPPITRDVMEPWVPGMIATADAALLVADLGDDDLLDATQAVRDRLSEAHVELVAQIPFDSEDEVVHHVRTALVANKTDAAGADARLEILGEWAEGLPLLPVTTVQSTGLESLSDLAYDLLGIIRIYTKVAGQPVDRSRPFTLPIGSTVEDLARSIHGDLERSLKYARVWGTGVFEGQTVKRDHELHDADVVELHA